MLPSPPTEWASVEQTIFTPARSASRTCSPVRSSRSGRPLTSSATPSSSATSNTRSRSRAFSGRRLISRPLGWLRQRTYGLRSACSTRLVNSRRGIRWPPWTLACTQSSSASASSGRSSRPSGRMSHSIPRRMRNGASASLAAAISCACRRTSRAVSPRTAPTAGVWSQMATYS